MTIPLRLRAASRIGPDGSPLALPNLIDEIHAQVNVWADAAFLKRLDAWRRRQADLPNRPEAMRRLADIALASRSTKSAVKEQKKHRLAGRLGSE
jgi:hypothetical protein